ncbi:uncharacterized protein LOC126808959 isoform X2 [Patella vulgata]|nr:uncharacterized protein LOC126808959 isoform X2 [Patella vulgata]
MSKRKRQSPIEPVASDSEEDSSTPMITTAEERITELLIKKLLRRGLVMVPPAPASVPTPPATTCTSTQGSSSSTTASTSTPEPSTSTSINEPSAVSTDPNIFSVNAAQLFQCPVPQPQLLDTVPQHPHMQGTGMSVSRHLSDKLRQDIWADRFVDFALLLPGPVQTQFALNISEFNEEPVLKISSAPKSKVLSFDQWQKAFAVFMDVMILKNPHMASSLLVYSSLISELAQTYGGKSFNYYDTNFRMLRQSSPYPWDIMHADFWLKATTLFSASVLRPVSSQASYNQGSGGRGPSCWGYNRMSGCKRQRCEFSHVCSRCGYKHPAFRCYATANQTSRYGNVRPRSPPLNGTRVEHTYMNPASYAASSYPSMPSSRPQTAVAARANFQPTAAPATFTNMPSHIAAVQNTVPPRLSSSPLFSSSTQLPSKQPHAKTGLPVSKSRYSFRKDNPPASKGANTNRPQ